MDRLSRRDFLRVATTGAAGLGAGASLGRPLTLRAQPKEVVMLGLWPFTGAFADVGPVLERGMKMALEEHGMVIAGRVIRYVSRDSETRADVASRRAEEAIETEGVQYVIGPWSSGVALAVSEVAKRRKVLHYFSGGTEDLTGKHCHRYSFQWAASPYTAARTVMDNFVKANPKGRRWYLLVADYAFARSVEKYLRLLARSHGVEIVGADRHPLGERRFSPHVNRAAEAKPDVICMVNSGLDTVQAAREIFKFGLTPKLPLILTWSSGLEELIQLTPEIRENMWVGSNFYYTADTPVAKEFTRKYKEKYRNPPGYVPAAAYDMTRLTMRAMEKANSTEVPDVIKTLEGIEVNDLLGKMRVDPRTHQTLRPYFFMRCKSKAQMKDPMDVAEIVATGDTPLPRELSACKDIGSL
ncbi:MAG: ABC transporter substrate-binding protein [Candidatus Rokubacteria bacterium]|nr:ABC transporter substrate-binding protein [Candidatus Rokubacteria bacterium]